MIKVNIHNSPLDVRLLYKLLSIVCLINYDKQIQKEMNRCERKEWLVPFSHSWDPNWWNNKRTIVDLIEWCSMIQLQNVKDCGNVAKGGKVVFSNYQQKNMSNISLSKTSHFIVRKYSSGKILVCNRQLRQVTPRDLHRLPCNLLHVAYLIYAIAGSLRISC